jgi:zinc/manganese transport system permease protein
MALHIPGFYIAAATTATAVLLLALMDDETPLPKEAVMGGVYAFSASLGMVVLSLLPYGQGQMTGLLFGSVLSISWMGIIQLGIFAAFGVLLALPTHANSYVGRLRFYTGLSLIIVPAIYAVGVLLVFAYLVMPALSVWRNGHNGPGWQALVLACVASIVGTFAAHFFDLPPSATVVLTLAFIATVTGTIIHYTTLDEPNINHVKKAVDEEDESELGFK